MIALVHFLMAWTYATRGEMEFSRVMRGCCESVGWRKPDENVGRVERYMKLSRLSA